MKHVYFVVDDVRIYLKKIDVTNELNVIFYTTYSCFEALVFDEKKIKDLENLMRYINLITILDPEESSNIDIEEFFIT